MNCGMEMQSKHGRRSSNKTKKQMHYRNWVFSEIEHKSMSGDKHRRSCIVLHVIVNIGTCEHHECCRLRIVVFVCVCGATQKTRCEQPLREFFFLHETICLDLLHKSQFFETKRYCCDGTGSQPPDRQTSSIPKHVAAFLVYSRMLWCEAITITLRWHTLICRSAHITYGCRSVR